MLSIDTFQDPLGHWHASINDSNGNTLATFPPIGSYGYDTRSQAYQAARQYIDTQKNKRVDIEGGGTH